MSEEAYSDQVAELAAEYLAGAMSDEDRADFENRIANGDHPEVAAFLNPILNALIDAYPPVLPSQSTRDAIIRLVEQRPVASLATEFFVQRGEAADWQDFGVPGVRMRMLFIDRESGTKKFLVKMDPGCIIPEHPHDDDEECYIIEGDLRSDDLILMPGDYMRAPAGTHHGQLFSQSGCLMMVTSGIDEHDLN